MPKQTKKNNLRKMKWEQPSTTHIILFRIEKLTSTLRTQNNSKHSKIILIIFLAKKHEPWSTPNTITKTTWKNLDQSRHVLTSSLAWKKPTETTLNYLYKTNQLQTWNNNQKHEQSKPVRWKCGQEAKLLVTDVGVRLPPDFGAGNIR